jgi:UDP-hydrolysing UDP-N-acetyl-D-glucosamine 2-epimerase
MRKKILVFIGSRANYSSIKSVLEEIKRNKKCLLQIILGASAVIDKYGDLEKIINRDGFKIDRKIYFLIEGENPITMAKSTGLGLISISEALKELKPNIVITIGDRFETMATTLATCYMNIPLAHTMGGEVTGTIDESIRHAVTKFSHIHFPSSKKSARRIYLLGENKKDIFNFGCPRIDLVKKELKKNRLNSINKRIFKEGVGAKLNLLKPFVIVSQHPVTTEFGNAENQILNTLEAVSKLNVQAIVLWPNADAGSEDIAKGIRKWREKFKMKKMHFFKNLEINDYIQLMKYTSCLVGNSSSGIREGAYIGTPVVNIGSRQNGRERGKNVIQVNYEAKNIYNALRKQVNKNSRYKQSNIYGDGNAAKKIINKLVTLKKISVQKKIRY